MVLPTLDRYKSEIKTKAMILKNACKHAAERLQIWGFEEGFFIVVKSSKKGVSNPNVSVKVRSKTIVKITIEQKV